MLPSPARVAWQRTHRCHNRCKQEQGERTVPVCRVIVCYFGGGNIDDGTTVKLLRDLLVEHGSTLVWQINEC